MAVAGSQTSASLPRHSAKVLRAHKRPGEDQGGLPTLYVADLLLPGWGQGCRTLGLRGGSSSSGGNVGRGPVLGVCSCHVSRLLCGALGLGTLGALGARDVLGCHLPRGHLNDVGLVGGRQPPGSPLLHVHNTTHDQGHPCNAPHHAPHNAPHSAATTTPWLHHLRQGWSAGGGVGEARGGGRRHGRGRGHGRRHG